MNGTGLESSFEDVPQTIRTTHKALTGIDPALLIRDYVNADRHGQNLPLQVKKPVFVREGLFGLCLNSEFLNFSVPLCRRQAVDISRELWYVHTMKLSGFL
ncbi:MAG: hypothetical protein LBR96_04850, partial [Treponema sp.]|nr:hypothetical protein [Treponema sp.]